MTVFGVLTIFLEMWFSKSLRGARMAPSGQSVASQILFSHRFSKACLFGDNELPQDLFPKARDETLNHLIRL